MKPSVLVEIIVTNQCNKRCSYCDLDFHSTFIGQEKIDNLYHILQSSRDEIGEIIINFFGGEPLLNFDIITYTIKKYQSLGNIKFSLGTNGDLLSEKIFEFLKEYSVSLYVSVDFQNYNILEQKNFLQNYDKTFLNIILEPENILEFSRKFEFFHGYKNLNFMPVYTTKIWNLYSLTVLLRIFETYKNIGNFFNYYNGFSAEQQYILETNGDLYQDLDSLLWLQCQYKIFDKKISDFVRRSVKIGNLKNLDFQKISKKYDEKKIQQCVFLLEKSARTKRNNNAIKCIFSKNLPLYHKQIFLFQEFLKKYFVKNENDGEIIFSAILQDSARKNYYENSFDNQLFDCSLEYDMQEGLQKYFKFSYFGTNMAFVQKVFTYFGYHNSLSQIEVDYKKYKKFLKDDTVTIGFKLQDGKLRELKIYYDLRRTQELLEQEGIHQDVSAEILLKSYTFQGDVLLENKIYIPPDEISFQNAVGLLSENSSFQDFKNYKYYDILYRYSQEKLKTVKFYYNLEEEKNKNLQEKIMELFPDVTLDFGILNVERELGVDFYLKEGIKKYSLYFGLYK